MSKTIFPMWSPFDTILNVSLKAEMGCTVVLIGSRVLLASSLETCSNMLINVFGFLLKRISTWHERKDLFSRNAFMGIWEFSKMSLLPISQNRPPCDRRAMLFFIKSPWRELRMTSTPFPLVQSKTSWQNCSDLESVTCVMAIVSWRKRLFSSVPALQMTLAPIIFAICKAASPTPLHAEWIRTVSPFSKRARSTRQ